MKRYGNLFDQICSKDNIMLAIHKASKGKKKRRGILNTLSRKEESIINISNMLRNGSYKTSMYHEKIVYEPKKRLIYSLPFFPDRIVHHAIMNVLEPLWNRFLDYACNSCRKTKGCLSGSKLCMKYVQEYRYVLQCDISKFYPSIDHEICKHIIRKKIKDQKVLNLLDEIIDSANTIPGATIGKNAPIGNLLSQWFGNLYLNEMDLWLRYTHHVNAYVRYCDDFVIFSNDKKFLNKIKNELPEFLATRLKLHLSKMKIYPVSRGIDFLGYRHFPEYILVRKRVATKIKRFARRVLSNKPKNFSRYQGTAASYNGILCHANSYNLRQSIHFDDILNMLNIKPKKKRMGDKNVKEFKDFATVEYALIGEKLHISDIVNKKIAVYNFKISPSKKKPGTNYLQIQIRLIKEDGAEEEIDHVVFTNGTVLMKQLKEYASELPFITTIEQRGSSKQSYYIFT